MPCTDERSRVSVCAVYSKKLFKRCCVIDSSGRSLGGEEKNDLLAVARVTEDVRYEFVYLSREMSLILLSEGAAASPVSSAGDIH